MNTYCMEQKIQGSCSIYSKFFCMYAVWKLKRGGEIKQNWRLSETLIFPTLRLCCSHVNNITPQQLRFWPWFYVIKLWLSLFQKWDLIDMDKMTFKCEKAKDNYVGGCCICISMTSGCWTGKAEDYICKHGTCVDGYLKNTPPLEPSSVQTEKPLLRVHKRTSIRGFMWGEPYSAQNNPWHLSLKCIYGVLSF